MSGDGSAADEHGQSVRATYAAYDASGRDRLWDRSNPGFDRLKRDSEAAIAGVMEQCLADPELPASPRYLDVGCGDGSLIGRTLDRWANVDAVGIDLLEDRIAAAREAVPGGRFLVASGGDLPFDTDHFDVASAITVFSSIPSEAVATEVAREIGRVLRPGGWLIWHDLRYDNPWNPAVHGVTRRRIADMFPGWQVELRSFTLIPPIARRLGRTSPVLYPLLHAIPPLRSHLIGRLRCPT
jgi:SAM-dependent methyltransferase